MKPFYQGKIDTFCAIYAVLNCFRLTHGIRTLKAREYFNDTLLELAKNPADLEAVLNQTTDYIQLVDHLLVVLGRKLPIKVSQPFLKSDVISVDTFWQTCLKFMTEDKNRTALFRFLRYFDLKQGPGVRHWTCIDNITDGNIRLYDSSHEAEAIQNLQKTSIITRSEDLSAQTMIVVQPWTLRLVALPF